MGHTRHHHKRHSQSSSARQFQDIHTNLQGTISSGTITLFEVGIPGLDIPGYVAFLDSMQRGPFETIFLVFSQSGHH